MFGFLIKKSFFDMWDNLLRIVLMNLGFIVVLIVPILLPSLIINSLPILGGLLVVIGVLLSFCYAGVIARMTKDIADYGQPGFTEFLPYLKETWKSSLIYGAIFLGLLFVIFIAFPFYNQMDNLIGLGAMVVIFWITVIWVLGSIYYFPVRDQLNNQFKKIIKKCFLIFLDNTGFTIMIAIGTVATLGISIFTALLIPGLTSVLLWWNVALKLRLYKYDYLEENSDADRKKIPWSALLIDDSERVGNRTLKGMIFPWKE
jgi:uncharacterized membrane protein YesL